MRARYAKVDGHPELLRDMMTNAIIPKETGDYREFVQKRKEMNEIKDRLSSLESSFKMIEFYLQKLVNERNDE